MKGKFWSELSFDWLNDWLIEIICVCCRRGHLLLYILLTSRWPRLHSAQPKITDSTVSASLHVNTEINQQENLWERFSVTDEELQGEPTTPSQWTPSGRRMMMKKVEAAAGFRLYSWTPESWSFSAREPPKPQRDTEASGKHNRKWIFHIKRPLPTNPVWKRQQRTLRRGKNSELSFLLLDWSVISLCLVLSHLLGSNVIITTACEQLSLYTTVCISHFQPAVKSGHQFLTNDHRRF